MIFSSDAPRGCPVHTRIYPVLASFTGICWTPTRGVATDFLPQGWKIYLSQELQKMIALL